MLKEGMKPANLPVKVWSETKIPAEVRKAICKENPGSDPRRKDHVGTKSGPSS